MELVKNDKKEKGSQLTSTSPLRQITAVLLSGMMRRSATADGALSHFRFPARLPGFKGGSMRHVGFHIVQNTEVPKRQRAMCLSSFFLGTMLLQRANRHSVGLNWQLCSCSSKPNASTTAEQP